MKTTSSLMPTILTMNSLKLCFGTHFVDFEEILVGFQTNKYKCVVMKSCRHHSRQLTQQMWLVRHLFLLEHFVGRPLMKNLRFMVSTTNLKVKQLSCSGQFGVIKVGQKLVQKSYKGSLHNRNSTYSNPCSYQVKFWT